MADASCMSGVPAARRDPRLRRYPLRRLRIPVGGRSLSLVAPDADAWRRDGAWVPQVERGDEPPYWLRVWPAAVALARGLARAGRLDGLRVLDLGCGLGVPGVQAAAQGAAVTFVDRQPDALAFAAWNAAQQPGLGPPPRTCVLDWSRETVDGAYDLVLASDVSYHRSHHRPLLRQLHRSLDSGGVLVHTDPVRELSGVFLSELGRGAARRHWTQTVVFGGARVDVRSTVAARAPAVADDWSARLGGSASQTGRSPA